MTEFVQYMLIFSFTIIGVLALLLGFKIKKIIELNNQENLNSVLFASKDKKSRLVLLT